MKYTTHLELHSQTTRLIEGGSHGHRTKAIHGILTLHDILFTRNLGQGHTRTILYRLQCRHINVSAFKSELLPLHSPLLRQSLLVSVPPLIDMLKFSGYPYPISGQFSYKLYGFIKEMVKILICPYQRVNFHITLGWNYLQNIHCFAKGKQVVTICLSEKIQAWHQSLAWQFLLTLRRACPTE